MWFAAPLNRAIDSQSPRPGYVPNRARRRAKLAAAGISVPSDLSVLLAFSGGGTRAAALALGVLDGLRVVTQPASLLDAVDVVSSVSGGSFTAAYFGLFGERVFSDFENKLLFRNIEARLICKLLAPWNLARVASPYFDRIDLASEHYERIFDGATFSKFPETAPYIAINATDMALGTRFPFTQAQFDLLGSDLSSYSVARAVAASSAFPLLLSPLTLKNLGAVNYDWDRWQKVVDQRELSAELNFESFQEATAALTYKERKAAKWIHLLDGGLADNLSLPRFGGHPTKHESARGCPDGTKAAELHG